jgi:hypothetical protein
VPRARVQVGDHHFHNLTVIASPSLPLPPYVTHPPSRFIITFTTTFRVGRFQLPSLDFTRIIASFPLDVALYVVSR